MQWCTDFDARTSSPQQRPGTSLSAKGLTGSEGQGVWEFEEWSCWIRGANLYPSLIFNEKTKGFPELHAVGGNLEEFGTFVKFSLKELQCLRHCSNQGAHESKCEASSANRSIYKSTWERVDSKGLYERYWLQLGLLSQLNVVIVQCLEIKFHS